MNFEFKRCALNDVNELSDFSAKVFTQTFASENTPENLNEYLNRSYAPEKLAKELQDPESEFYFLYAKGKLAGYLKLNTGMAQSEEQDPDSLEIERIYIEQDFQKQGLGQVLMDFSVKRARDQNKKRIWLGVWEKNFNAQKFYEKNGFTEYGAHEFVMGDDRQTDLMLEKAL